MEFRFRLIIVNAYNGAKPTLSYYSCNRIGWSGVATVYSRTFQRAVEIKGGVEICARELGVSPRLLEWLMDGGEPVPIETFLRAVDILQATHKYPSVVKGGPSSNQQGRKL